MSTLHIHIYEYSLRWKFLERPNRITVHVSLTNILHARTKSNRWVELGCFCSKESVEIVGRNYCLRAEQRPSFAYRYGEPSDYIFGSKSVDRSRSLTGKPAGRPASRPPVLPPFYRLFALAHPRSHAISVFDAKVGVVSDTIHSGGIGLERSIECDPTLVAIFFPKVHFYLRESQVELHLSESFREQDSSNNQPTP